MVMFKKCHALMRVIGLHTALMHSYAVPPGLWTGSEAKPSSFHFPITTSVWHFRGRVCVQALHLLRCFGHLISFVGPSVLPQVTTTGNYADPAFILQHCATTPRLLTIDGHVDLIDSTYLPSLVPTVNIVRTNIICENLHL